MEITLEGESYTIETDDNLNDDARRLVNKCQDIQTYIMRKSLEDIPRTHPQYERLCMEAMHTAMCDPAYEEASRILADVYIMNCNPTVTLRRVNAQEKQEASSPEAVRGRRADKIAACPSWPGDAKPGYTER